jgi:hypothetical protein
MAPSQPTPSVDVCRASLLVLCRSTAISPFYTPFTSTNENLCRHCYCGQKVTKAHLQPGAVEGRASSYQDFKIEKLTGRCGRAWAHSHRQTREPRSNVSEADSCGVCPFTRDAPSRFERPPPPKASLTASCKPVATREPSRPLVPPRLSSTPLPLCFLWKLRICCCMSLRTAAYLQARPPWFLGVRQTIHIACQTHRFVACVREPFSLVAERMRQRRR